ncbi:MULTISPECIES: hypothetical protein [unclassified Salegentibacter]|nr:MULTISPECIES: hypothetical protein [unclassified Salegentibacter]MBO2545337.1 hypothetical protein [Salegentibacter sp. BDJ18]
MITPFSGQEYLMRWRVGLREILCIGESIGTYAVGRDWTESCSIYR